MSQTNERMELWLISSPFKQSQLFTFEIVLTASQTLSVSEYRHHSSILCGTLKRWLMGPSSEDESCWWDPLRPLSHFHCNKNLIQHINKCALSLLRCLKHTTVNTIFLMQKQSQHSGGMFCLQQEMEEARRMRWGGWRVCDSAIFKNRKSFFAWISLQQLRVVRGSCRQLFDKRWDMTMQS